MRGIGSLGMERARAEPASGSCRATRYRTAVWASQRTGGVPPARKNFDHFVGFVQRSLLTSQTPLIHSTRATYDETPIPDDRGTYHLRFVVPWSRGSVGYVQRSLLTSRTPLIHSTRPTYDETPIPADRGTYHLRFVVP